MGGLYRHHWVDQPGYKDRRETLQISQLCSFKNTETTTKITSNTQGRVFASADVLLSELT